MDKVSKSSIRSSNLGGAKASKSSMRGEGAYSFHKFLKVSKSSMRGGTYSWMKFLKVSKSSMRSSNMGVGVFLDEVSKSSNF